MSTIVLSTLSQVNAGSKKIPSENPFRSGSAASLAAAFKNQPLTKVYYSGNVTGMRESCGCAAVPKGGLERRFNFLKKEGLLKKPDDSVLLDFGNMLFKSAVFAKADEKEALANAEKMMAATNAFAYTAVNFGALDRAVAPAQLSKIFASARFPWVASNIFPATRFSGRMPRRVHVKLKNAELVIFGLSSLDEKAVANGWRVESPASVLEKEIKDLPENTFPVILSDMELAELTPLANSVKRLVLFLGSRETGGWDKPIEMGQSLLVHLRQQGQEWGLFKFAPQQTKGKSGWFNPQDAEDLAKRWEDLKVEAESLQKLASSPQKDIEIKNVEAKMQELAKLAPQTNDIAYSIESIEMNSAFDGKNEVSKFMK